MNAGEKKKNYGKADGISCLRQLGEVHASTTKVIGTLPKIFLTSLFFLLLFLGFPEAQVPDVHKNCTLCHIEDGVSTLREGINETCIGCHTNRPDKDHPIGLVVKDISEKLPLDQENRITCFTCHDPHGKGTEDKLLRLEFNILCIVCHKV